MKSGGQEKSSGTARTTKGFEVPLLSYTAGKHVKWLLWGVKLTIQAKHHETSAISFLCDRKRPDTGCNKNVFTPMAEIYDSALHSVLRGHVWLGLSFLILPARTLLDIWHLLRTI